MSAQNLQTLQNRLPQSCRMTKQRQLVYDILTDSRDHPTASEVFHRTQDSMPTMSMATVYNCLETLTTHGLIKQVNLDRAPSRYCANTTEHIHFHCTECGQVIDAPIDPASPLVRPSSHSHRTPWELPDGTSVTQVEIALKGICSTCTPKTEKTHQNS